MTIISQPAALSFAGNLENIVIASETDIAFSLSVDDSEILNELYTPIDGKITVSLKSVVNRYLKITVPDYNIPVTGQSEAVKTFTATIGNETISFAVIKGGVDGIVDCPAFLSGNFLTWQSQQKNIVLRQPEWLNYYAATARTLIIKAYFADKTTATHNINLPAGKLLSVNICYDTVNNYFPSPVSYYDIWVEADGNRLTYVQRYIPVPEADNTEIYVFENTLGGLDSFACTGELIEEIGTEGSITTQYEQTSDSSVDLSVSYEQKTGILKRDESRWLRDFFTSGQRYHITGDGLRKIYMEEQDNKFKISDLNTFTFEFFYCNQTFYNKVIRNRESLPELLEFPEPDGLFFLTPRLSEYPATVYADDLIIPVQHPYTGKWMQLSASLFAPNASLDINLATYTKAGIASFSPEHFVIENGHVTLKTPGDDTPECDFGKYFYEQEGKLYCRFDLIGEKEVSAYGLGTGEPGAGGASTLGQLSNVGAWADELPGADRVLVQLNGATHWTSMALSAVVGLDTAALSKYLTDNKYAKLTDLPSLNGYATESWVSEHYLTREGFDEKMSSWFKKDADGNIYCEASFYSTGEVAAYGAGEGGGNTGVSNLSELGDVSLAGLQNGNILQYAGTKWTNKVLSFPSGRWEDITGKPDFENTYLKLTGGTLTGNLIAKNITAVGFLNSENVGKSVKIGSENDFACHYQTTADRHWFNKSLYIMGDVYGGSGYNRRLAYMDELTNVVLYKETAIDATRLDPNKWYPVSIYLGSHNQVEIRIIVDLQGNKPSWATHAQGFSCRFVEIVNGAGWGSTEINRRILANDYKFAGVNPIGGVTQNEMGSTEIIYVRGGGCYYCYVSTGANATLHPSGYNWVSGSYSYSAPIRDSILNNNWNWMGTSDIINRANKLLTARLIWGQNFDGSGNIDGDLVCNGNITASSCYTTNWFRSIGETGWYNSTYGGGIYMTDTNYVRVYNNKVLYNDGFRGWGIGGNRVGLKLYSTANIGINLANSYCTWGIYSNNDGNMYIGRRTGNADDTSGNYYYTLGPGTFTVSGNIVAAGEVTAYSASDVRLKENVCSLDGLSYLRRLNFYEFDWNGKARELTKDDRRHGFGGLAHEFRNVLPDLVGNIYNSEYLGIRYEKLIPHLGAAILQMDRVQDEHERRIARIEQKLNIQ